MASRRGSGGWALKVAAIALVVVIGVRAYETKSGKTIGGSGSSGGRGR